MSSWKMRCMCTQLSRSRCVCMVERRCESEGIVYVCVYLLKIQLRLGRHLDLGKLLDRRAWS